MLSKRKRVKQVEAELSKRIIVWKGEESRVGVREVTYEECS